MADSLHLRNQHVLIFSFFIGAEERGIAKPWANMLDAAAVAGLILI